MVTIRRGVPLPTWQIRPFRLFNHVFMYVESDFLFRPRQTQQNVRRVIYTEFEATICVLREWQRAFVNGFMQYICQFTIVSGNVLGATWRSSVSDRFFDGKFNEQSNLHANSSFFCLRKANIILRPDLQVFLYKLLDNVLMQYWLVANFDVY